MLPETLDTDGWLTSLLTCREGYRGRFRGLPIEEREQLRAAMSYPERGPSVRSWTSTWLLSVRTFPGVLSCVTSGVLRLPDRPYRPVVCDRSRDRLKGVLPLNILLVNDVDAEVSDLMQTDFVELEPDDWAEDAAKPLSVTILCQPQSSTGWPFSRPVTVNDAR